MTSAPLHAVGRRLERDGVARVRRWAVLEEGSECGDSGLVALGRQLLALRPTGALVLAASPLPFIERMLRILPPDTDRLQPRDSETAVFLGDIPLLRGSDAVDPAAFAARLYERRGLLADDLGLLVAREATAARAGVIASSLHHAAYVWTLTELLQRSAVDWDEPFADTLRREAQPVPEAVGDLAGPVATASRITAAGRRMVELGLVDSVFGNLSARTPDGLLISRTGSALDALEDELVAVPLAGVGVGAADRDASSELPAHRAIHALCDPEVIVHGHPRFTVALSLLDAPLPGGVPRIEAEPGSSDLGLRLAAALPQCGIAVATGHGPFAIGGDFAEALRRIIRLENACRHQFLRALGLAGG